LFGLVATVGCVAIAAVLIRGGVESGSNSALLAAIRAHDMRGCVTALNHGADPNVLAGSDDSIGAALPDGDAGTLGSVRRIISKWLRRRAARLGGPSALELVANSDTCAGWDRARVARELILRGADVNYLNFAQTGRR